MHVDDLVFGGSEDSERKVVGPLRAKYPFKHWQVGQRELLGKMLVQEENWDSRIRQKEYAENVDSLHMSKERRRQKDTCVTEEERKAMRGALGELNCLSVCSRPDISAACSLLQQRVSTA